MPEITKHKPGNFCWLDLATTDPEAAKQFYAQLFDWSVEDMPAGEGMTYTFLRRRGKDVAALSLMDKAQQDQGVPPYWFTYVAVEKADEAVKKAASLGGTPLLDAFDVLDAGRMSIIQDPTGAMFGLWEPKQHTGAGLVYEPGSLCWNELLTNDPAKAETFYRGLFGWGKRMMDLGGGREYTVYENGGEPTAGMMKITPDMGPTPSNWLPYFSVTDCDGAAAQVEKLGGEVMVPPTDVPDTGRFAVARDPQGAAFAFIKMNAPA
jgi:predicted enzyme related to lactoylglutathione lyase